MMDRQSVSKADGMRMPVSGNDSRLVSRKYLGNVSKYRKARGPVVI